MMTLEQLQNRVTMTWIGYGTYRVKTTHRGRQLSGITHNTLAIDRIKSDDCVPARKEVGLYTLRSAYQALHDEIIRQEEGEV